MPPPTPSDAARQALARARAEHERKNRQYQVELASTCAEVQEVYNHWLAKGFEPKLAVQLTRITLDNFPEEI